MYDHKNPTIGSDMTGPRTKPVEKKPTCEKPVEKKAVEKKPVEKKPLKDEKKAEKKRIDPWTLLLFGPPRATKPVEAQPKDNAAPIETEDPKDQRPRGSWWF